MTVDTLKVHLEFLKAQAYRIEGALQTLTSLIQAAEAEEATAATHSEPIEP